jgi:hypothetical protein
MTGARFNVTKTTDGASRPAEAEPHSSSKPRRTIRLTQPAPSRTSKLLDYHAPSFAAILGNAGYPAAALEMERAEKTARTLGFELIRLEVRNSQDIRRNWRPDLIRSEHPGAV